MLQSTRNHLLVRSDFLSSRYFLISTMLIAGLAIFAILFINSVYSDNDPIVKISNGKLIGARLNIFNKPLYSYLNIPYALPASEFRFKQSQLDDRIWKEDRIAKNYGAGCPQPEKYIKFQNYAQTGFIKYDEDCLNLNVWTPVHFNRTNPVDEKQLKPVVVFIHGGALLFNSASEEKYFDGRITG